MELIQRTVPEKSREDLLSILDQLGSFHPSKPPWYSSLIAVDPAHQRKGHGSALTKHALIPCYKENMFAYLESTNPTNTPYMKDTVLK